MASIQSCEPAWLYGTGIAPSLNPIRLRGVARRPLLRREAEKKVTVGHFPLHLAVYRFHCRVATARTSVGGGRLFKLRYERFEVLLQLRHFGQPY